MTTTSITSAPAPSEPAPPGADGPVKRAQRRDAARNRELLMDAAREVFAERGLDATLDDIARAAGVGVGTAYRHFASKNELIGAIAAQMFDRVEALATQALAVADPWAGLVGFLEAVLVLQADHRGLRDVVMGAKRPEEASELAQRLESPLVRLLERARAAGVVRPDAVPADIGFIVIMLCTVTDIGGDVAPDAWRRYLPMMLAGLKAGGPSFGARPLTSEQLSNALASHHRALAHVARAKRGEAAANR